MGLGSCIALVVHNSETSTAAVAHFDAMTIVQSATGMLKKVIGSSTNDKITVYLVGGECIDLMIVEIYQLLQRFDLVDRIVAASIFNRRYDRGEIAINRLTGQICNLVPTSFDPPMISLWDKVPLQFSPAIIKPALRIGPPIADFEALESSPLNVNYVKLPDLNSICGDRMPFPIISLQAPSTCKYLHAEFIKALEALGVLGPAGDLGAAKVLGPAGDLEPTKTLEAAKALEDID